MKFKFRLLIAITILCLFAITAQAQVVPLYGCLQGNNTSTDLTNEKVSVRTGNQDLDNSLVEDITALDTNFGISVPVYFINNGDDNAFFTPRKFPNLIVLDGGDQYSNVTGSIFLDVSLLIREFKENNGSRMSLPAIVGHEAAHGMQYRNRFPYNGKFMELHADLMAGWFVGYRGIFRPQNVEQAAMALYKRGDYDFFNEDHHGTPQERARAFGIGYSLLVQNRLNAVDAYNYGLRYVQSLGAK